jgi:hypothetical protein
MMDILGEAVHRPSKTPADMPKVPSNSNNRPGENKPNQWNISINSVHSPFSPSQNSFLVRSSPTANANDDGDAGSSSSPTMNDGRNGGSSQSAPRVNAFLDRMSARSVPVGFFGQQQQQGKNIN